MEGLKEHLANSKKETFVTYKGIKICYGYNPKYNEWFTAIYRDATDVLDYTCLGHNWTNSKEQAVEWGMAKIDEFLDTHTLTRAGWMPKLFLGKKTELTNTLP